MHHILTPEGNNKSLGFSYKDSELIHPNDLMNKKLCDVLKLKVMRSFLIL